MALYEDSSFSFSLINPPTTSEIVWRRPREIVQNPKFFGIHCCPVRGDWEQHFRRRKEVKGTTSQFFLVAVASLTKNISRFLEVVPEQSFENNYTGKFRFKFYENGRLKEIEIDDRLPTTAGELLYSKSVNGAFWFPLLEKAYAKFCGGYDKITTGLLIDVLKHLTGRIGEYFSNGSDSCLPFSPEGLYQKLSDLVEKKCLIVCKQNDILENNEHHGSGLVVIGTEEGRRRSNDGISKVIKLVRVRHPSGCISESLRGQLCISGTLEGDDEGCIAVEKFLKLMQCVYYVDFIEILAKTEGVDPYTPLNPVVSEVNLHRCKRR